MRSTGMAGWLLVAVAIALSTTAYAGTVTASVTLSGPDECWVEEDVTYTATGTFGVDPEIQEELDDGEATLKEEYDWSYAPAQLISGGGPQDDWVTIRYNDADGGQHHTVSVNYTVTVTYADDTSDSASAGDSIQVWVKQVEVGAERNKDTICAGGVDSSPHQAIITATVTGNGGQPLAGKTVTFSLTNSDESYPASIDPQQATTDASGKATTTLTSSQKIGVTATVKATCQNVEAETDPVTMAKAQGTWEIDPQVLIADGESTADVSLTLEHAGGAVDGHSISWRIFEIEDGNGNLVYTADPEWGSKAGYGSIAAGPNTTDATGTAATIYTVGTEAGTIWFEAQDTTVVENSPASYTSPGDAKPTQIAVTRLKAYDDIPIVGVGDTVFAQDFLPNGTLDITVQHQPVCEYKQGGYTLVHTIGFYPLGRSTDVEWRQTWTIKKGTSVKAQHSKPEGGTWAQGATGEHSVDCPDVVGVYELLTEMNVRAPSANLWYTLPADEAECKQYLTFAYPCCGENHVTESHLDDVCTWAHNTTTSLESAEAVHGAITGGAIGNCICNTGGFDDFWEAAEEHSNGQCCCWSQGMVNMLQVLGIQYTTGYVNSAPEPGVKRSAPTSTCQEHGTVFWAGYGGGIWNNFQGVCGKGTGYKWFSVQSGYEGTYGQVYQSAFPDGFEWVDQAGLAADSHAASHLCTHLDPYE